MILKAIEHGIQECGGFDLADAFHTVRIARSDEKLTAFEALGRVFEWMVLPFGRKNAPAHFAAKVEYILGKIDLDPTLRKEFGPIEDPSKWMQYYMDDVLIMARTAHERNRYNEIFLRC
jgi:hypothetical protein